MDIIGLELNDVSVAIALGSLLLLGYIGGYLARKVNFPAITGYLIVGVIFSPQLLHIIPFDLLTELSDAVTPIALSIIAYIIGGSLRLEELRGLKKSVLGITLFEGIGAFIVVFTITALAGKWLFGNQITGADTNYYIGIALVAGATSVATAPAATVAVLHEAKARGPLTTTLLSVVALDDALAVIIYSLAISPAAGLINGSGHLSLNEMLLFPFVDISLSLILGALFAVLIIIAHGFLKGRRKQLTLVLFASIMLCGGIAEFLGLSFILANMAFGFILINKTKHQRYIDAIIGVEDLVFIMFFTLAGAHFEFNHLAVAGLFGLVLLLSRAAGKYSGAFLGATLTKSPRNVKKYLGLGLLPQAGVAIGLAMLILGDPAFEQIGTLLVSAVLTSVIINELSAPPVSRLAVQLSGEGRR